MKPMRLIFCLGFLSLILPSTSFAGIPRENSPDSPPSKEANAKMISLEHDAKVVLFSRVAEGKKKSKSCHLKVETLDKNWVQFTLLGEKESDLLWTYKVYRWVFPFKDDYHWEIVTEEDVEQAVIYKHGKLKLYWSKHDGPQKRVIDWTIEATPDLAKVSQASVIEMFNSGVTFDTQKALSCRF